MKEDQSINQKYQVVASSRFVGAVDPIPGNMDDYVNHVLCRVNEYDANERKRNSLGPVVSTRCSPQEFEEVFYFCFFFFLYYLFDKEKGF